MTEFSGLLDLLGALVRLFGLEETAMFPAAALVILFLIVAIPVGLLAQGRRVTTGTAGMIGEIGVAVTDVAPRGRVYVHSEYWNAVSDEAIPEGTSVVVVSVDRMVVTVKQNPAS